MSILDQFKEAITHEIDLFIKNENNLRIEDERAVAELKTMVSSATSAAALRRKIYYYMTQEMGHKIFYMFRNDLKNRMIKLLQIPQYSLEALLIDESQEINRMNTLLLGQIHSLQAMIENSHPEQQKQIQILQEENAELKEKLKTADQTKQVLEQAIETFGQKTEFLELQVETLTNERDIAQEHVKKQAAENQHLKAKAIEDERQVQRLQTEIAELRNRQSTVKNSSSFINRLIPG